MAEGRRHIRVQEAGAETERLRSPGAWGCWRPLPAVGLDEAPGVLCYTQPGWEGTARNVEKHVFRPHDSTARSRQQARPAPEVSPVFATLSCSLLAER